MTKCRWALSSPLEEVYHDTEWGVPVHDDRLLFEFLILEGAQAGLSWSTVLKKRDHYRIVFDHFNAESIAAYDDAKIAALLTDPGIIRNRLKVNAAISNARAFLKVREEFGSFDAFIWHFTDGKPIQNTWRQLSDVPTNTPVSDAMSKELQRRGFKFVGSTICYAFMQAVGIVNDHTVDCFRYGEIARFSD